MGTNLAGARDELIIAFTAAWKEQANALNIPVKEQVEVGFFDPDGKPDPGTNPGSRPWARLTVQHTGSNSPMGARRVMRAGIVTLQTFHYRRASNVDALTQRLAAEVASAMSRHRGNVDLFGITPIERPINNGFAQCDVAARFTYTEHLR